MKQNLRGSAEYQQARDAALSVSWRRRWLKHDEMMSNADYLWLKPAMEKASRPISNRRG